MRIYKKNENLEICTGLSVKEFSCNCKNEYCRATIITERMVDAYESFRLFVDKKLTITNGYRCPSHNKKVGGAPLSQHQAGNAIDIASFDLLALYETGTLITIAKNAGFTYIQYYREKGIFHLDCREGHYGS
jgi:hypothetical protein